MSNPHSTDGAEAGYDHRPREAESEPRVHERLAGLLGRILVALRFL